MPEWILDKLANNGLATGILLVFWLIYRFAPNFLKRIGVLNNKDINVKINAVEEKLELLENNHYHTLEDSLKELKQDNENFQTAVWKRIDEIKETQNQQNIKIAIIETQIKDKLNGVNKQN